MSKASILFVFLTVFAQLRGQYENSLGRWGRYGVLPRTQSTFSTVPRPLLNALPTNFSPQKKGSSDEPTIQSFGSSNPITYQRFNFNTIKKRKAEFDNAVTGLKSSSSNLNDQSATSNKQVDSVPTNDLFFRTSSSSSSRRFLDPPPLQSSYPTSYVDPSSPSPPESSITSSFTNWLMNRKSISLPNPATPPTSSSPPPPQFSVASSPSFDSAPPASCAVSKTNATPPINQIRRFPSLRRSKSLTNDIDVKPNLLSKSSNDPTQSSNFGSQSSNSPIFQNSGSKPNRQYNGSSSTQRYGGTTVVSENLPNDSGKIEIKISGRQIDDDRMSQMIKEAQNAITTVLYYPLYTSISKGTLSIPNAPSIFPQEL